MPKPSFGCFNERIKAHRSNSGVEDPNGRRSSGNLFLRSFAWPYRKAGGTIRRWHGFWIIRKWEMPVPTTLQYPLERQRDLQRRWNRLLQRTAALKDHPSGRRRAGSGSAPTADGAATAG